MTTLMIALAGGLGAAVRFVLDAELTTRLGSRFPWGIVLVNVTGSFLIGLATGSLHGTVETVVATGFLGGYTTFSTASLDSARLALRGKGGRAVAHAVGTAAVCVVAAWAVSRRGRQALAAAIAFWISAGS